MRSEGSPAVPRPDDVHDRVHEWSDLSAFCSDESPGMRLGVVSGRRRQGKSYLLRRLAAATGGVYTLALEQARVPALQRLADQIGARLNLPTGQLRFDDWEAAVEALVRPQLGGGVIVIDELPYLLRHSPELPSILQHLYDRGRDTAGTTVRLIVCGSALSIMTELLSGTKALRGRATLELILRPFDYRAAATYWRGGRADVAFHVDAVFGGTPGYRDLVGMDAPDRVTDLGEWLATTALNPSHALFREVDYLLREDPRVTDRALYHSVLTAISEGAGTPAAIGARIGRDGRALAHPLDVLETGGFVRRDVDVLRQRGDVLRVADPIVRFGQLIVQPRLAAFEERCTLQAWRASADTFASQILGPHFERLAQEWVHRFAGDELGVELGAVGRTTISDPAGRTRHEVDVVVLAAGQPLHARKPRVAAIGEAKAGQRPVGTDQLRRLEHVRTLMHDRGVDVGESRLLLFSRAGFDRQLSTESARRVDVELIDLDRLYGA